MNMVDMDMDSDLECGACLYTYFIYIIAWEGYAMLHKRRKMGIYQNTAWKLKNTISWPQKLDFLVASTSTIINLQTTKTERHTHRIGKCVSYHHLSLTWVLSI